jgi:general secretion pathway protein F
MPNFRYKAKKLTGEEVSGILAADSQRGAVAVLSQMHLFPLKVEEAGSGAEEAKGAARRRGGRRIKGAELAVCYRQLADLLRAGVPLMRALAVLKRQTANVRLADIVGQISDDVARGSDLTTALARHPKVFSSLAVSMVRAGEQGGFLEDVLTRVAMFQEKQVELQGRITSAMAYPTLLVAVGTFAVAFLVTWLVPRFKPMFDKMHGNIPVPTQMLLGLSAVMVQIWWVLLLALIGGVLLLRRYIRTSAGRLWLDRLKLRTPVVGAIFKRLSTARFCRTLGTLLKSGIPMLTALRTARDAASNQVFAGEIDRASAGVKEGQGLGHQLGYRGPFDPIVVDMISVGEETGNLDQVLVDIAESYDQQVDRAVATVVTLLEPVLLLFMGGIVGFIVVAILLPIFTMSSQMG